MYIFREYLLVGMLCMSTIFLEASFLAESPSGQSFASKSSSDLDSSYICKPNQSTEAIELKKNELTVPKLEKTNFTFKKECPPQLQYGFIEEDILDDASIISFELEHPSKPLPYNLNYSELPELLIAALQKKASVSAEAYAEKRIKLN